MHCQFDCQSDILVGMYGAAGNLSGLVLLEGFDGVFVGLFWFFIQFLCYVVYDWIKLQTTRVFAFVNIKR